MEIDNIKNICYCIDNKLLEDGRVLRLTWSFPNMGTVENIIFMDDINDRMFIFSETELGGGNYPYVGVWNDRVNLYVGNYLISIVDNQDIETTFRNVTIERIENIIGCVRCGGQGWIYDNPSSVLLDQLGPAAYDQIPCPKCDGITAEPEIKEMWAALGEFRGGATNGV